MPIQPYQPYRPSRPLPTMPDPQPIVPNPPTALPFIPSSSTYPPPTTTTTSLPTPPPYTGTQSTHTFLRPSKKPEPIPKTQKIVDNRPNPCSEGSPLMNEFQSPITCNFVVRPNGGCPPDHWCHTGASFATTACCPNRKFEDKCQLGKENGEGEDLIPRWYYDGPTAQCKRFLYKGVRGNANNFVTNVQCLEACGQTETNVCAVGTAARGMDGNLLRCSTEDSSICPAGFYCHFGEQFGSCCEKTTNGDRCQLPLAVGDGPNQLKRFYFNTVLQKCLEFQYRGARGNENNFGSLEECRQNCNALPNPCPSEVTERRECSPSEGICGSGEWCHLGAHRETSICCPDAVADPCRLPVEVGIGSHNLTRWYSDPDDQSCNKQCRSFIYKGAKGNQNNFETKEQCEKICKSECSSPCSSGELLLTSVSGKARQCGPTSPCPSGHWCHIGMAPDTTVCCSAVKRPCELGMAEGSGDGMLTRWFYDRRSRQCLSFIYHGFGGNQNNFLSEEECQAQCPAFDNPCGSGQPLLVNHRPKICSPQQRCPGTHFCHIGAEGTPNFCCPKNGDPCEQPVSSGTGNGSLRRFYYDREHSRRCREFVYHGAKGNANNFLSLEDCELVCQVTPNPCRVGFPLLDRNTSEAVICGGPFECPDDHFCHVGSSPQTTNCCPKEGDLCDSDLELGSGSLSLDRWFFDRRSRRCLQFVYKGTKGNANNFVSREECIQNCPAENPCFVGEPLLAASGAAQLCAFGELPDLCPSTHFCHGGGTATTVACCPKLNISACAQRLDTGVGNHSLTRYFFDSNDRQCHQFEYKGIRGNQNNFLTKSQCERECPAFGDFCPHGMPKMDFQQKPVQCGIHKSCPIGYICHMNVEKKENICCENPAAFCTQQRERGKCSESLRRFGYDPFTDLCVEYQYSGCGGTLNNFDSMEKCTQICCKDFGRTARDFLPKNLTSN